MTKLRLLVGAVLLVPLCWLTSAGAAPRVNVCNLLNNGRAAALLGGKPFVEHESPNECAWGYLRVPKTILVVHLSTHPQAWNNYRALTRPGFRVTAPNGTVERKPHRYHSGRTLVVYTGPITQARLPGQPTFKVVTFRAPHGRYIVEVTVSDVTTGGSAGRNRRLVTIGKRAITDVLRKLNPQ